MQGSLPLLKLISASTRIGKTAGSCELSEVKCDCGRSAIVESRTELETGPDISMPTDEVSPGGSETILVVDDEAVVLRFCNTVLSGAGYRVITAPDAHAALEICASGHQRIDLALVDAIMPCMSGPELADCLTGLGAGVRVLMMSGYPEDTIIQRLGHWINYEKFLRKPFKPPVLLSAVREALQAPASRTAH